MAGKGVPSKRRSLRHDSLRDAGARGRKKVIDTRIRKPVMAVVGVLGHASMLSTAISERTREFGILRIVGAGARDIRRVVLCEAMVGGLLGAAAAVPLSLPVLQTIGRIVGRVSGQPLVLPLAATPVIAWLAVCIAAAALGGLYPSIRAARWSVREALVGSSLT